MVIGSGTAQCKGCGYEYSPEKGDPDFPVAKGIRFQVGWMVEWVGLINKLPQHCQRLWRGCQQVCLEGGG